MAGNTIVFTSLTAANPYTPPPAGYTKPAGSDNAKIESAVLNSFGLASGATAIWYDNTSMQGNLIKARIKTSINIGASCGAAIINASGNGYCFITNNTSNNFRYFYVVAGQLGTQIGSAISVTPTIDTVYFLERDVSTGIMRILDSVGSSIGASSPADLTYADARFAAALTRGGYLKELSSDYTPSQSVTSINGGNPFTASQTTSSAVTTGFTGLPASITSDVTGLTFNNIGGTTNAPTFNKSVRTDGAVYPKDGTVASVTFTNGAETASGNITCNKDADETEVIAASPINDDVTCLFGAIFAATGRSAANGDEVYHKIPSAMLTNGVDTILPADAISPSGEMQFYNAGTFTCWVWTNATGVNYYYSVTITESGGVVINGGLTSSGLTSSGLTRAGLTSAGL